MAHLAGPSCLYGVLQTQMLSYAPSQVVIWYLTRASHCSRKAAYDVCCAC